MKVLFCEVEDWEKDFLKNKLSNFDLEFIDDGVVSSQADSAKEAEIISIFVGSQVNKDVLEKFPNLKMIATRSTGFDHIDLQATKEKNVVVCNVPTYGENTVAEHTFGLILNLSRKIYQSIERVRKVGFLPDGLCGFDLKGKTIGVVGMGHIGQHVARIAAGFEMNVLAFDVNQDKKLAKQLGFKYATMEDLLANSDIITLHVPYNQHTHHLINLNNISHIKKGAYLINTSRGGVVQTDALTKALDEKILAGAGLDVLEGEHELGEEIELLSQKINNNQVDFKMLLQDHMLMERENVIITPHNAFNSIEALERILQTTVENIKAFESGKSINTIS